MTSLIVLVALSNGIQNRFLPNHLMLNEKKQCLIQRSPKNQFIRNALTNQNVQLVFSSLRPVYLGSKLYDINLFESIGIIIYLHKNRQINDPCDTKFARTGRYKIAVEIEFIHPFVLLNHLQIETIYDFSPHSIPSK